MPERSEKMRAASTLDDLTAFRRARAEFERRLHMITDDSLTLPTPCRDWDAGALIQHVIDGDTFAALLLDGAGLHDAITILLDSEESPSFGTAADAVDRAFSTTDPEQIVDHPIGPTRTADFLEFRTTDYAGHAWDLARATGQDETLDPELIEWLWTRSAEQIDRYAESDHFGGGAAAESYGASRQNQWLDRIGRRP